MEPERKGTPSVPVDREAEMATLGAMIFDSKAIGEAMEVVGSEEFAWPQHRTIYDAIVGLHLANRPVDLVVLRNELAKERRLDGVGGADYLMSLVEGVPNASSVGDYAALVHEKACLRRMMEACQRVVQHISTTNENLEEVRAEAERALFQALAKMEKSKVRSMPELLQAVFSQIQDIHDRKSRITGLSTGFYELDDMTSGLQKGHLYVVAGRPSMGKTSLAMNIVEHVGLREGKPVLFFSLEMGAEQVAQTMLCSHARIDSSLLRSGRVDEESFQRLVLAAGAFHEARIFVDDSADLSALDMRTRARRWAASDKIELVVVDYLQKMSSPKQAGRWHENRQVEIASISSNLKSMAKELGVPVIALAQLNRGPEGREDRRPLLSDLRESGAIEQDADAVALLFREEYYDPNTERKGMAELNLAKNRTGPTGTVNLAFIKTYTRFENLAAARPTN